MGAIHPTAPGRWSDRSPGGKRPASREQVDPLAPAGHGVPSPNEVQRVPSGQPGLDPPGAFPTAPRASVRGAHRAKDGRPRGPLRGQPARRRRGLHPPRLPSLRPDAPLIRSDGISVHLNRAFRLRGPAGGNDRQARAKRGLFGTGPVRGRRLCESHGPDPRTAPGLVRERRHSPTRTIGICGNPAAPATWWDELGGRHRGIPMPLTSDQNDHRHGNCHRDQDPHQREGEQV